ncbi:MAG TPA: rod shape-determining protein MreC [Bacteroidota bacterium]|nr:rod shape-determining protein MreC [Bacteroidota bacterium]
MIRRIYDVLFLFKEYVLLATLVLLSIGMIALNDNVQVRRIRTVATVAFGVVEDRLSFIPAYFGLRSENALLRRINVSLADEASQLREEKLENIRLRQLLGLKQRSSYPLTAAEIVSKNLTLLRNTLTLDAGRLDGIEPLMPVVGDGGLVGLVTDVSDHFSVVNILWNTDFRVSAKIQRSRVDGIVAWDGRTLALRNVAKTRDVVPGDVVLSSEYSSSFPPDIRIGIVSDVQIQEGALFKTVTVMPTVDFVKLEEVFVMDYLPDEERSDLEQEAKQKTGK